MKAAAKKKILFILHLPPPVHGVSVMNEIITRSRLINESFDCDFVNLSTAGKIENLQKHSFRKYFLTAKIMWQTFLKIIANRYHRVYITPFPYGFAFVKDSLIILLCRMFRKNIVLHLHTYGFKKASGRSELWKKYYRFVFKRTEVICVSALVTEDIGELYTGNIHILPNGIRQVNFENKYSDKLAETPVNLLFLSNLIKGKGILILIDAVELVKKHGYAFHLRIVGPENDVSYRDLKVLIKEKGLESHVTLVGPKYGEEKYDEFRRAGIFILPSDYETFGLVLLEAMQFGVPCISTNFGGIPAVLGNGRGLLLSEITPEALADAIEHLISHPEKRQSISNAGFEFYKAHYTEEIFERNLATILNDHSNAVSTSSL